MNQIWQKVIPTPKDWKAAGNYSNGKFSIAFKKLWVAPVPGCCVVFAFTGNIVFKWRVAQSERITPDPLVVT